MRPANRAEVKQPAQLPVPGLKPEVVMDHQPDTRAFRIADERDRVLKRGSQGLLTEHMNASFPRETADVAVRVGGVMTSMKSGRSASSISATSV